MKKKIIGIIVFIMLVGTTIPIVNASEKNNSEPRGFFGIQLFSNCYIEASGILSAKDYPALVGTNMWKIFFQRPYNDEYATIFYLFIRFNSDSEITVYTEENGNILWQQKGHKEPQFRILKFRGIYITTLQEDGPLHVILNGNADYILKNEK